MFLAPLAAGVGEAAAVGGTAAAAGGTAAATAGLFGTGISLWQGLGLLGTAVSSIATMSAGAAQADAYKLQATNALIQSRQQALEYQKQGVQVMNKMLETNATINARAAAGGIDPFSGSAGRLSEYAFSRGADEYNLAKENAASAILQGQANSEAYLSAAESASSSGIISGITGLMMGAAKMGSIGGFGTFGKAASLTTPIKSVT